MNTNINHNAKSNNTNVNKIILKKITTQFFSWKKAIFRSEALSRTSIDPTVFLLFKQVIANKSRKELKSEIK